MKTFLFMALPTLIVVLLKNKLSTLDRIKIVQGTIRYVNLIYIGLLFFTPFNLDEWASYLLFVFLLIGIQKEIFLEAKNKFFDFVEENKDNFKFVPTYIGEEFAEGVLLLENNADFGCRAIYLGQEKMELEKEYNVNIYISVNMVGDLNNVFCSAKNG